LRFWVNLECAVWDHGFWLAFATAMIWFGEITHICYHYIESSVIKKPSVVVMAQIAKALGVSIEDLIK